MSKVSVVVPIYKVERYIEKCVRSLMEQTLDDIEFIFVNDCSPDKSISILLDIIKEYPDRKKQVQLIQNEVNRGVAYSRLIGVEKSHGEYVCFVDSDDWVEQNMYETLYTNAKKNDADIVVSNYYNEFKDGCTVTTFILSSSSLECLSKLYKKNVFPYTLWCQMFRKTLFETENLIQIEKTNHGEDLWLNICAHVHSKKTIYSTKQFYHYNRMNENSMVKTFGKDREKFENQGLNLKRIADLLYSVGGARMNIAINYLQFQFKHEYKSAFKNDKVWFAYHKKSHSSILKYERYSFANRLKMRLIYSNFYIWHLYNLICKE